MFPFALGFGLSLSRKHKLVPLVGKEVSLSSVLVLGAILWKPGAVA